ncbi:hypothetical protein SAMN04487988_1292 [Algoriphagus hitonicola]|uniref:Uncharacterized protein n=1 Tax=Algoriphagus hitonicola TaxID=435880 RepID=A0A1I2XXD9_9BACT|nr:hypothetical protein SAMN04487988_1292 [Algoriphagus hitonicola]
MKKRLIQLVGGLCLCFVAMLGVDLGSGNGDFYSVQLIGEANAQIYQACPGDFLAMSSETSETMLCAVNDPLPRLVEITISDCEYQLQTCCPPPPVTSPTCQGLG